MLTSARIASNGYRYCGDAQWRRPFALLAQSARQPCASRTQWVGKDRAVQVVRARPCGPARRVENGPPNPSLFPTRCRAVPGRSPVDSASRSAAVLPKTSRTTRPSSRGAADAIPAAPAEGTSVAIGALPFAGGGHGRGRHRAREAPRREERNAGASRGRQARKREEGGSGGRQHRGRPKARRLPAAFALRQHHEVHVPQPAHGDARTASTRASPRRSESPSTGASRPTRTTTRSSSSPTPRCDASILMKNVVVGAYEQLLRNESRPGPHRRLLRRPRPREGRQGLPRIGRGRDRG